MAWRGNSEKEKVFPQDIVVNDITNARSFDVRGSVFANTATSVQKICLPEEPPLKNVRFGVQKPIQTFTGREEFLEDLHKTIQKSQKLSLTPKSSITVLTQTPSPLISISATATGGLGKTETVRMYIQRHHLEFDHVIWIDAEEPSVARAQFKNLATELKIPTTDARTKYKPKEFTILLEEIYQKLFENQAKVLIVFDNANQENLESAGIRGFLPPMSVSASVSASVSVQPTVLITSRDHNWNWNWNWGQHRIIQLNLWSEEDSVNFLLEQLSIETTGENEAMALRLSKLFGFVPIAIQSAVSVILQKSEENIHLGEDDYGIQEFLSEIKEQGLSSS